MASFFPKVGSWYHELDSMQNFEIVAVDTKTGEIEVQYESGDMAEFRVDNWGRLNVIPVSLSDIMSRNEQFEENFYDDLEDFSILSNNPLDGFEGESYDSYDDLF